MRLLDGNSTLKKLDDRFLRAILLFLLLCKLLIDISDVLRGSILPFILLAEAIRNALLAFIISNPFRIFSLMSSSLPPIYTVLW
jgi:hypothetical protein